MTDADHVPLDKYQAMTEDELYEELGLSLLGSGPGMTPDDRREARGFGRDWFHNQYDRIRHGICLHPKLQGYRKDGSDVLVDAGAVYGIAGHVVDDPVQAAIVGVLAVRIGLTVFCAGVSPEEPPGGACGP
ncbi:hypothetical protein [Streptomyces sp. WMMC940]|uniref:hypothetical protein n=1 Tax=Streptomyces sp. WMMC940 TaxID=3015153 RepID=UPI0022B601E9|nr:hypothetical protein [Streptomyces sp. WMMC940]MCZ7460427.1 hypothetical protein [Streptomyces sp. WMMC940]